MSTPTRIISEQTKRLIQGRATIEVPVKSSSESVTPLVQANYELGDLLVSYLEQLGVEYVFGVPGGPIEPLYNALARSERRGGPRAVIARHETGAAFMADGYARNSGKLGVCCGTVGPGTTNLITGVASAHDNHTSLLVITAQTSLANFGKGATQESADTGINTVAMFSHCTHYSSLISHVDQFEQKLVSAVTAATKAPNGPAHLSVPLDVMRSPSGVTAPSYDLRKLIWQSELVDNESISILVKKLVSSKKTVFLIGEGAAAAIDNILTIALMLDVSIVTTPHGKGLISPYHPQFCGVIGFCGHKSAMNLINSDEVDLIVAIGTSLQETATNAWTVVQSIGERMIHVDDTEENLMRSPLAQLHVQGNINKTFIQVLEKLRVGSALTAANASASQHTIDFSKLVNIANAPRLLLEQEEIEKTRSNATPIKPQRLMNLLPKLFPAGTRYLCDSGNSMAWSIHYLHPHDRRVGNRRDTFEIDSLNQSTRRSGRRETSGGIFWTCLEFGSMGWAIGSSIGTALACPNSPTVCITGDGSMLMSGGDVTVALQEKLNIVFIILNDSEYGMVKHGQRLGSGESIGFTLPNVDFVKWGQSMGISGYSIHSPEDLEKLDIARILSETGPKIFDVYVDPEEVPPIKNRLQALGTVD
tara:strand:+ start:12097 stop:14037 length:1941 start_codon:yes stop_codon:yes gene_type:complete